MPISRILNELDQPNEQKQKKKKTSLESFFHEQGSHFWSWWAKAFENNARKYTCDRGKDRESQMLQIDLGQINATALTYPFENQPF